MKLNFSIKNKNFCFEFIIVLSLSAELILGVDFLSSYNSEIFFLEDSLCFRLRKDEPKLMMKDKNLHHHVTHEDREVIPPYFNTIELFKIQ